MMLSRLTVLTGLCLTPMLTPLRAAEPASDVKHTRLADRVRVEIGGHLFSTEEANVAASYADYAAEK